MNLRERASVALSILFSGKSAYESHDTWDKGQPVYSGTNFVANVNHGYRRNELIYSCIALKADSASLPTLRAYNKRTGKELVDHPIRTVLTRPNPYMTEFDLWSFSLMLLDLAGRCYWEKQRSRAGRVVGLWPLRPDWVRPLASGTGLPGGYQYAVPGLAQPIPLLGTDVLEFKLWDPLNLYGGLAPVSVAGRVADIDNSATDYLKKFFDQGGIPPGILASKLRLNDPAVTDIRRRWHERYGGWQNWGEPVVLDSDMTYQKTGLTFTEMGFDVLDARSEARICAILRTPPIMVGAKVGLDRATYCLPASAKVWTPSGLVNMAQVRPGNILWSLVDGSLQPRAVIRAGKTGHKALFEIRTKNRTLRATGNHPVLVRVPGSGTSGSNANRHATFAWRRVDELAVGDRLVQVKALPDQGCEVLPDGRPATEGMLRFCGALIGDGTVTPGIGIRMAMPPADRCVDSYKALACQLFTKQTCQSGGAIALQETLPRSEVVVRGRERDFGFSSAAASRELAVLGLAGRSHTKRVPSWVYGLSLPLRLAFLAGIVDTDGSVDARGTMTVAFCQRDLSEDVRALLISCGIQCCNLRHQVIKAAKLPNAGIKDEYESWGFTASSAVRIAEIPFADPLYRCRVEANSHRYKSDGKDADKAGLDPDLLGFYSIRSIKPLLAEDVYDLTVEGGQSFVADGVVVHNSNYGEARKSYWQDSLSPQYKRLGDECQNDLASEFGADIELRWDFSKVPAFQEDRAAVVSEAVEAYKTGGVFTDEFRACLGLPPDETGLLPKFYTVAKPAPAQVESQPAVKALPDPQETKAADPSVPADEDERLTAERKLQTELESYFVRQRRRLVEIAAE